KARTQRPPLTKCTRQRRARHEGRSNKTCRSWWAQGRDGRVDEASEHVASTFAHPTVEVEPLLLEALDEPAQKPHPDLVLADLVLDAVLEVGVVVDFHHHNPAVGLLEVYAVETVADRARGAHRDVDDLGRRLVDLEGAEAALVRRSVGTVFHDLPMAACHAVLADEQRLAREHA